MKMIRRFCDKCGEEFVYFGGNSMFEIKYCNDLEECRWIDLCTKCQMELFEMLTKFLSPKLRRGDK